MYTLITLDYENSLPVVRKDQPLNHCYSMLRGGYYKVQVIDQSNDIIFIEV